jgi:ATP-dependent Clp protease adaptor protein ClpS
MIFVPLRGWFRVCTEASVSNRPFSTDVTVTAEPRADEATRTRLLPPYNLVLENDEYHSFDFVVLVLCEALGCELEKAFLHTREAHETGQAVVWTGSKEVAELKWEQVRTFHEVRESDGAKLGPLNCRIEPAPGA